MKCKYCGEEFVSPNKRKLYCSVKCRDRFHEHNLSKAEWDKIKNAYNPPIDNPQEYFNKYNINLDYVSGWKGTKHKCTVRCRECGYEYLANMDNVRKGRTTHCPECIKISKLREEQRQQQIDAERKRQSNWLKQWKAMKAESRLQSRRKVCDVCGKEFVAKNCNGKRCSKECSKKYSNSYCSRRKDSRIVGVKHDVGITTHSLMLKENGICYLCGKQCDLNDYYYNNNDVFIAGDNYPSVEHVIPISLGGTDTWDNVRLAHRRCNSVKSNKYISKNVKGGEQLALF